MSNGQHTSSVLSLAFFIVINFPCSLPLCLFVRLCRLRALHVCKACQTAWRISIALPAIAPQRENPTTVCPRRSNATNEHSELGRRANNSAHAKQISKFHTHKHLPRLSSHRPPVMCAVADIERVQLASSISTSIANPPPNSPNSKPSYMALQ